MQDWNKPKDNSNNPFSRMSIRDQLINLDGRISRFETGAAYELQNLQKSGLESAQEFEDRGKAIKAAKNQSKYLLGIINDDDYQFSSIDELRVFMRNGIEYILISLSYGED